MRTSLRLLQVDTQSPHPAAPGLDQDACQQVMNEFDVQRSISATVTLTCLNCCAQSSEPSLRSNRILEHQINFSSRLESQSHNGSNGSAAAPSRAQPDAARQRTNHSVLAELGLFVFLVLALLP
ncbi:transcription factor HES-2-like protein [Lates japonicus]|uniref:Transcription factor HES-2-like protein n=1 Tax=Lates japonicus TaxID=270547 RepID=A0AAD3NMN0_LATJO|nr:transcription factor HES-2-like protein [Lates japonicus]